MSLNEEILVTSSSPPLRYLISLWNTTRRESLTVRLRLDTGGQQTTEGRNVEMETTCLKGFIILKQAATNKITTTNQLHGLQNPSNLSTTLWPFSCECDIFIYVVSLFSYGSQKLRSLYLVRCINFLSWLQEIFKLLLETHPLCRSISRVRKWFWEHLPPHFFKSAVTLLTFHTPSSANTRLSHFAHHGWIIVHNHWL